MVRALLLGRAAKLKLILELGEQRALLKLFLRIVVGSDATNDSFGGQDHEIGQTDLVAPLLVDRVDARLRKTCRQSRVVTVFKVDAAVRAAYAACPSPDLAPSVGMAPEVHQVVALKAEHASGVDGLVVGVVLMLDDFFCQLLVLRLREGRCCHHFLFVGRAL